MHLSLTTILTHRAVCVCDECHLMNREMLEEIRFLLNTHLDSKSPMGLILVGQTELWKKLQLQAYTAIRQRIDVQSVLNHYDRSQTGAYIRRQLDYAGCGRDIFTDAAMLFTNILPVQLG